ncbi:class F sortase [Streptomyces chiangmaiensis]|uniref:Class F sortase n=1 Tax=Streptomyces chiangmaiensis TaxID=766497 RepID=A0ABU7FNL2_9ACTN|nr:class F sortase [Streptomyces chiangmaiensis]MED7825705.1 class F sortase [Streptomyces chiangmaiensis]
MRKVATSHTVGDAAIASVTVVALFCGIWLLRGTAETQAPPQPTAAQAASGTDYKRFGPPALPPSPPDRIRIPSLRVDAPLTGLGLTSTGNLQAPPAADKNLAGWYEHGATPGESGTAVVAGHVDTTAGPAVFYDLGALKKGSTIDVHRRDGSTAIFTVYAVKVFQGKNFPDDKVYGPAARPELRVITCGGGYSRRTGYQGNVVVFARLAAGHRALTIPLRLR